MNLMLPDESGQASTSRTVFWYGCLICLIKLGLSNMNIYGFVVPEFNGSDFAVALSALGGIRALDKHIINTGKKE